MSRPPLAAPFRGERYADAATLVRRVAPPYDVIAPPERAELAARDAANIVHIDLPVAPEGVDPYQEAARLLAAWRSRGVLVRDAESSAYVLRTTTVVEDGSVRARSGVFLAVAAEPFSDRRILPHERTHQGPKEDRRRLTRATGCNISPVFLLAPDASGELAGLLAELTAADPWARAEALGATQEIWIVGGEPARRLAGAAGAEPAYIADGHHRYETAVRFREEAPPAWRAGAARTLAHVVSFRDPGLAILPTHRLVAGRPVARAAFLAAAARYFVAATGRQAATCTAVFADSSEVPLVLREDAAVSRVAGLPVHPAVRSLAVTLCDGVAVRVVAASLLGASPGLGYTAEAAAARAAVRRGECALALLLPPTRLEEVRRVADAGEVMPPKSTYFAPKVPTGVVLRPLDGDD